MDISIVIPNYNGVALMQKNLPHVITAIQTYKEGKKELIIIDDASSDNSESVINEIFKQNKNIRIKFFINKKNEGFSASVNRGVSEANGTIVILLNTDVTPQNNFIAPLVHHFHDESVFAVGCLEKSIEETGEYLYGRGVGRWQKGFLVHHSGDIDKANTLWVSGGSGAFSKRIWETLGGMDTLYKPFYWEDIDLSYRALKTGYKVLFEKKSVVIHEHEKGAIRKKFKSFYITTIAYRNQFVFVWKNATDVSIQLSHAFWLPYHFIKALFRLDLAFYLGFFRALLLLPDIIISSNKAQKLFRKKDSEVIASLS